MIDSFQVLTTSFQQRRKMLRQSLKNLLASRDMSLPEEWGKRRPEELAPPEFVELTRCVTFHARKCRETTRMCGVKGRDVDYAVCFVFV